MKPINSDAPQYWLLPGETPVGPFRTDQILEQIQAGQCTWTTRASLVGSSTWLPLNQVLTLAPIAALVQDIDLKAHLPATTSTAPNNSPVMTDNAKPSNLLAIFVGVLILCLVGYWLYSSYFAEPPLTPQQVCYAFNFATSAKEAKQFVTPNMYAALQVLFSRPDSVDDGTLELTSEQPAPAQIGGRYVGFRAHFREATETVVMQGVFHVVSQSGWKINDMILVSVNGQSIQPALSVAREYEYFRDPQHPSVAQRHPSDSKQQAQQWYQSQVTNNNLRTAAAVGIVKSGAGKWLASIVGLIGVAILGWFGKQQTANTAT